MEQALGGDANHTPPGFQRALQGFPVDSGCEPAHGDLPRDGNDAGAQCRQPLHHEGLRRDPALCLEQSLERFDVLADHYRPPLGLEAYEVEEAEVGTAIGSEHEPVDGATRDTIQPKRQRQPVRELLRRTLHHERSWCLARAITRG
jgi:hypothetical protein